MNTPDNVPPVNDVRFLGWVNNRITNNQLFLLRKLLREEGVKPEDLYGNGFTSLEDLSRWAASWGISYLDASQEARFMEDYRRRLLQHDEEMRELRLKQFISDHYRGKRG